MPENDMMRIEPYARFIDAKLAEWFKEAESSAGLFSAGRRKKEIRGEAIGESGAPDGGGLFRAMRYCCADGGKRIRAALAMAVGQIFGLTPGETAPYACAIEMIHAYSLAHDDMPCMDDDDTRRGKPSAHKAFGEGMALLAGDALLTAAFETIAEDVERRAVRHERAVRHDSGDGKPRERESHDAKPRERESRDEISREEISRDGEDGYISYVDGVCGAAGAFALIASASGALGMAGGQSADLLAAPSTLGELREMHRLKTGALIRASVLASAALAGAGAAREALDEYAGEIGLAFQIGDDILDAVGDKHTMGKATGRDAALGKKTYASFLGVDGARDELDAACNRALAALGPFSGEPGAWPAEYMYDPFSSGFMLRKTGGRARPDELIGRASGIRFLRDLTRYLRERNS